MIIGEWKPIEEIATMLDTQKNVLLVGCAACMAECSAGGEKEVETLAPLLRMAVQVKGRAINIYTKTLERQCEWEFIEELTPIIPKVEAVLSLACGIGVQAMAERFPEVRVYPGVNTTSLAIREEPGLWAVRCEACGDCMLAETFGLCPIARCAKSLLNGPCGGTRNDGKCEVDQNVDCVWKLIVERASVCGRLEDLMNIRKPKQWSHSCHGGQKRMLREDLRP